MKVPKSTNKDVNELIKLAKLAGWRIQLSGGGHIKCFSPDGEKIIILPITTNSLRAIKNAKSEFKKVGLITTKH